MKHISTLYTGQMKTPLETAIYWVKFVAKHKGAPHLRSNAAEMPFYVYYNLDCFAFLIVCCSSIVWKFMLFGEKLFLQLRQGSPKQKIS